MNCPLFLTRFLISTVGDFYSKLFYMIIDYSLFIRTGNAVVKFSRAFDTTL